MIYNAIYLNIWHYIENVVISTHHIFPSACFFLSSGAPQGAERERREPMGRWVGALNGRGRQPSVFQAECNDSLTIDKSK